MLVRYGGLNGREHDVLRLFQKALWAHSTIVGQVLVVVDEETENLLGAVDDDGTDPEDPEGRAELVKKFRPFLQEADRAGVEGQRAVRHQTDAAFRI